MTVPNQGLRIEVAGWPIRLKWHRLRRSLADPEFSVAAMANGLRIGASMELDLQVRADGGFVVLHDETLDRETTGSGLVANATGPEISNLRYRDQERPPLLSEDISAILSGAHPSALLQLDMKNTLEIIGNNGLNHFAAQFADCWGQLIVSGGDLPLIRAIADRVPGIRRGFDPTDDLLDLLPKTGLSGVERHLLTVLRDRVKPDMVYLQWEMLVAARRMGLDMVALAHAEGVAVDAWTHTMAYPAQGFSDREWAEFEALVDLRPDQITTDEPVATETALMVRTGTFV